MTHSAASQTAAQMARHGLLALERGADARQRIARLTEVLQAAERAVLSRPMRRRIADAAGTLAGEAAPQPIPPLCSPSRARPGDAAVLMRRGR